VSQSAVASASGADSQISQTAAHRWFRACIRSIRRAEQDPARVPFAGRPWNQNRTFTASMYLPHDDVANDLPRLVPLQLATIRAEMTSTLDAKALRASSEPPPGLSEIKRVSWLMRAPDERQVFAGMRNMFMQSGVPAMLQLEMIVLPAQGLCVWLMCALVSARHAARAAFREEPTSLDSQEILSELRRLQDAFGGDEYLLHTISKINGITNRRPWEELSGKQANYGQAHSACEALANLLNVHVPVFVLARHDDKERIEICCSFCGDASAPNAFGERGGAVVTYEGGPLLSHVDVLVPAT